MPDKTRSQSRMPEADQEPADGPGVAIIGAGAVGSSLARTLYRTNYRLLALISRDPAAAKEVAEETGSLLVSKEVADIPHETRLFFICTREDAIPTVVDALLSTDLPFRESVVAHVSGRETAAALSPLAERGARTLSFHPLGSFPPGNRGKTFSGLTIGLEGDPLAVAVGKAIAVDIGAVPVEIPASAKAAYHLAAAMTSNFLVTLLGDVRHLLAATNLPGGITESLAEDTLENLRASTPEEALTGPIVRADSEALGEQIQILARLAPELLQRFVVLAGGTIDLALRSGRISFDEAEDLRRVLESAPAG